MQSSLVLDSRSNPLGSRFLSAEIIGVDRNAQGEAQEPSMTGLKRVATHLLTICKIVLCMITFKLCTSPKSTSVSTQLLSGLYIN